MNKILLDELMIVRGMIKQVQGELLDFNKDTADELNSADEFVERLLERLDQRINVLYEEIKDESKETN